MSAWGIAIIAAGVVLCVVVLMRHVLNSYPPLRRIVRDDDEYNPWAP